MPVQTGAQTLAQQGHVFGFGVRMGIKCRTRANTTSKTIVKVHVGARGRQRVRSIVKFGIEINSRM